MTFEERVAHAMPLPVLAVERHIRNGVTIFSVSLDASDVPGAPSQRATVYLTFKHDDDVEDPTTVDQKINIAAMSVLNHISHPPLAADEQREHSANYPWREIEFTADADGNVTSARVVNGSESPPGGGEAGAQCVHLSQRRSRRPL